MHKHRSNAEIDEIIDRVRSRFGVSQLVQPDIVYIAEELAPTIYPGFKYLVVDDSELPNEEAEFNANEKSIRIRRTVDQKARERDPRAIMTVAHELGHLILGHGGVRHRSTGTDIRAKSSYEVGVDESEAKYFAAAFLAPTSLAYECGSALMLQSKFGLSSQAAEIRFAEIEKCRRVTEGVKRPLPAGVIDFLNESRKKGYKLSRHFDELE